MMHDYIMTLIANLDGCSLLESVCVCVCVWALLVARPSRGLCGAMFHDG
jgi:hypothetical protein